MEGMEDGCCTRGTQDLVACFFSYGYFLCLDCHAVSTIAAGMATLLTRNMAEWISPARKEATCHGLSNKIGWLQPLEFLLVVSPYVPTQCDELLAALPSIGDSFRPCTHIRQSLLCSCSSLGKVYSASPVFEGN